MKYLIIACLISATFLGYFSLAEAHELKTDGSIIATLHIDPNDDPVAGGDSVVHLSFVDRDGNFDVSSCDCSISIMEGDKDLLDTNDLDVPFVFPQKDIYTIKVQGLPKSGYQFQPFNFSYDVRIDQAVGERKPLKETILDLLKGHGLHILLFGAAIVISIIVIIRDGK